MSWLVNDFSKTPGKTLRELLDKEDILVMPGAHAPLYAILAKKAGFKAIYLSGGAFSALLGLPDIGLFTLTELTDWARKIYRASGLPMLVDVDTGFGSEFNVARTVREMEDAHAAAIQIEDQVMPKRCGHLDGKELISKEDMILKIRAAKSVKKDLLICARTDANAVYGLDDAIDRAKSYVKAGADIIFPEALKTEHEFKTFARSVDAPLLANMTEFGKTPYYSAEQFRDWGYKIVIFPVTSLRISAHAVEELYAELMSKGTQKDVIDKMQKRKDLYKTIEYDKYGMLI